MTRALYAEFYHKKKCNLLLCKEQALIGDLAPGAVAPSALAKPHCPRSQGWHIEGPCPRDELMGTPPRPHPPQEPGLTPRTPQHRGEE